MSFRFDPHQRLIIVPAQLSGPSGCAILRLALDTGATVSVVSVGMLVSIGYDPGVVPDRSQVTTGSGVEYVASVAVQRIECLGEARADFSVLAHTLPPSAGVDGLLGLNFFRDRALTIDFRNGLITVV